MNEPRGDGEGRRVPGIAVVLVVALLALGVGTLTFLFLKRENVAPIQVPGK